MFDIFGHKYPYQDAHELNLDWLLEEIKRLGHTVEEFIAINKITFKGVWDITEQYPTDSIVTDGNGKGWISKKPVPAGIELTDNEYWLQILNYDQLFDEFRSAISDLNTEVENIKTELPFEVAGRSKSYYLDAVNGNDNNDGRAPSRAWKTFNKVIEIYNLGASAEMNIFFMGDSVYHVPTSCGIIWTGTPHWFAYNGSPTVYFDYNEGAGPRFYSCHPHLEGLDNNHRLKIDSAFGGVYFEGCQVHSQYVDFLVPTQVISGGMIASYTSFRTKYHERSPYATATINPALRINQANISLHDIDIAITDNVSTGIFATSSSMLMMYGGLNVTDLDIPATDNKQALIYIDNAYSKLTFSTTSALAQPNKYYYMVRFNGCSCEIPETFYNQMNSYGTHGGFAYTNTFLNIGNSITYLGAVRTGGLTFGDTIARGFLSNQSSEILLQVDMPRQLMTGSVITSVNFDSVSIYTPQGALAINVPKDNIGIVTLDSQRNIYRLIIRIVLDEQYKPQPTEEQPAMNNVPVTLLLKNLSLNIGLS